MRALLDTNVLASGITGLTQKSKTASPLVMHRWNLRAFELLTSEFVLAELEDVLRRPYFARLMSMSDRERVLDTLRTDAVIVTPDTVVVIGIATHWQDDLVLSAAVSGNADYLVTGDADFRRVGEYQGVKLRTPAEFLWELDELSF